MQEPLEEGVDLTWPEITLMITTGHSHSPQESMVKCPCRTPKWKQVWFDLADDLGDALQLPNDLAGFLEWPEDAINEWHDAQSPSTPCLHALLCNLRWPCQRRRVTCGTLLLLEKPDWSLVPLHPLGLQLPGESHPHVTPCQTWWNGQRTGLGHTPWEWGNHPTGDQSSYLCRGCTGGLPEAFTQQLAKRQAAGFRLPTAQAKKLGQWDLLPSLSALCCNSFLFPGDLQGSQDICEMRKEKTVALAKALQSCSEWSGGPYNMMCSTARDL